MAIAHPPLRVACLILAGLTLGCGNVSPQAPGSAPVTDTSDEPLVASYSVQQLAAGRVLVRRQCRRLCRRVADSRLELRRCTRLCERTFRTCARGPVAAPGFAGPDDDERSPDFGGGQEPDRDDDSGMSDE